MSPGSRNAMSRCVIVMSRFVSRVRKMRVNTVQCRVKLCPMQECRVKVCPCHVKFRRGTLAQQIAWPYAVSRVVGFMSIVVAVHKHGR